MRGNIARLRKEAAMDTITTQSRASNFVEVKEEFILDETERTRTVFKAAMHSGGIRGDIIRYRKNPDGTCEELIPVNFNSLHPDDGIKITLPTEAIRILYEKLKELELILEKRGIRYGTHDFTIADPSALVINSRNKATIIRKLLAANLGEEVWDQLAQSNPDIATRLASAKLHEDRLVSLRTFEQMLSDEELTENDWQNFFEENTWIFGYGLRYQILRVIQAQPNYGGATVSGIGGQRGDFLAATEAETKFTCLVEIKTPNTPLLRNSQYRNGAWGISKELSGAISQVQVNCAQWEISDSRTEQNQEELCGIYTISPKGIVVIGNTHELNCRDKRNSFERFRQELRSPEIITYDELFERAKYIVDGSVSSSIEIEDDDFPF